MLKTLDGTCVETLASRIRSSSSLTGIKADSEDSGNISCECGYTMSASLIGR